MVSYIQPEVTKLAAVENFAVSESKKQERTDRKFIPNYAEEAAPLTDLTKKNAPNAVVWTEQCDREIEETVVLCSSA